MQNIFVIKICLYKKTKSNSKINAAKTRLSEHRQKQNVFTVLIENKKEKGYSSQPMISTTTFRRGDCSFHARSQVLARIFVQTDFLDFRNDSCEQNETILNNQRYCLVYNKISKETKIFKLTNNRNRQNKPERETGVFCVGRRQLAALICSTFEPLLHKIWERKEIHSEALLFVFVNYPLWLFETRESVNLLRSLKINVDKNNHLQNRTCTLYHLNVITLTKNQVSGSHFL